MPKMKATLIFFLLALLLPIRVFPQPLKTSKPKIQHATKYQGVNDISQYWVSEKLDGIRGYWNGKQLLTRQGNIIHTPKWFTKNWPSIVLDGELWIGRNQFQATLSCVRKKYIDENCWRKVHFMIFDLPEHTGAFTARIQAMEALVANTLSAYLNMIKQQKLKTTDQLDALLNSITANQGEGLMIHKASAYYHAGRTTSIMKLKVHQEADAKVIGHIEGKGKYSGMLGALRVETNTGVIFNIGSGFSDRERKNPPKIGDIISFKYNGKTKANIPRFARFFRIKPTE